VAYHRGLTMNRVARRSPRRAPAATIVIVGAIALLGWLGYQSWDAARRDPGSTAGETEFRVEGLDCPVWCSVRLMAAIDGLDGARVTTIDREHGRVLVRHDASRQPATSLRTLLERHGFPVVDATPQATVRTR
jgi:hypothetical protein